MLCSFVTGVDGLPLFFIKTSCMGVEVQDSWGLFKTPHTLQFYGCRQISRLIYAVDIWEHSGTFRIVARFVLG